MRTVPLLPWEHGVLGFIFGTSLEPTEAQLMGWAGPVPPDLPPFRAEEEATGRTAAHTKDEAEMTNVKRGFVTIARLDKRNFKFAGQSAERTKMRIRALSLWATILSAVGTASGLHHHLQAAKDDTEREEIMADAMAKRATSTLLQRAYQVMAFNRWLAPHGVGSQWPVTEPKVYEYIRWLRSVRAAPTRATAFLQALTLANHLLDIKGAEGIRSARVEGAAEAEWMRKRVRRPRDPLTASMLSALEVIALSHEDRRTRIIAGFVVAMVHWRARLSDAMHPRVEPVMTMTLREKPCAWRPRWKATS